MVPLPCYPPFRDVVALAGRELVPVETDPDDEDAALDLAAVEEAFRAGARTLLLCNPHNPLGRVRDAARSSRRWPPSPASTARASWPTRSTGR